MIKNIDINTWSWLNDAWQQDLVTYCFDLNKFLIISFFSNWQQGSDKTALNQSFLRKRRKDLFFSTDMAT